MEGGPHLAELHVHWIRISPRKPDACPASKQTRAAASASGFPQGSAHISSWVLQASAREPHNYQQLASCAKKEVALKADCALSAPASEGWPPSSRPRDHSLICPMCPQQPVCSHYLSPPQNARLECQNTSVLFLALAHMTPTSARLRPAAEKGTLS